LRHLFRRSDKASVALRRQRIAELMAQEDYAAFHDDHVGDPMRRSSVLSLAVMQYRLGIVAIIGSIGVSIIILTGLQSDPQAGDRGAILGVVSGSSRHIVSTTVTIFGGFLPLILNGGASWPPFAAAIAGGVLLSTVVCFYFTPPVFALTRRRVPVSTERASSAQAVPQVVKLAAE
jgi:hypothetical protein